jgi:hypothetical protein
MLSPSHNSHLQPRFHKRLPYIFVALLQPPPNAMLAGAAAYL